MDGPSKQPPSYRRMTADALVARLRDLEVERAPDDGDERARLLQELETHQVELEMQNRELRETQTHLEEARASLAELYDFAPNAYFALDEIGRIREANLTAASLFGFERGVLIGKLLTNLVVDSQRRALRDHLRRCIAEGARVQGEFTFTRRRGGAVVAQVASVPSLAPDGRAIGCMTALTDITELKRAQEKLAFLADSAATLGSSFDYRASLATIARKAVPTLGDICIVDLMNDGVLFRLEVAFADPTRRAKMAPFLAVPL